MAIVCRYLFRAAVQCEAEPPKMVDVPAPSARRARRRRLPSSGSPWPLRAPRTDHRPVRLSIARFVLLQREVLASAPFAIWRGYPSATRTAPAVHDRIGKHRRRGGVSTRPRLHLGSETYRLELER